MLLMISYVKYTASWMYYLSLISLLLFFSLPLPLSAGYCGSRTLLTNDSGIITDGEGDYTDQESCMFIIKLNTNRRIRLTFNELHLECGWDYFNIFDGDSLQHPKLLSLSGDQVDMNGIGELSKLQVVSSSSRLLMLFLTDASARSSGFNISYSSIPPLTQTNSSSSGACYTDCNQTCYLYNDTLFSQCSRYSTVPQDRIVSTTLTSTRPPLPRAGHTAVLYLGCVYLYGGYTFESQFDIPKYYYSLFRRCLPSEDWEIVTPGPPSGPWPVPRYGHSSVLYKDALFVYGGTIISYGKEGVRNEITNQLWRLNLTSMTWTYIPSSNDTLPSTGHVTEVVGGDRMLVFFGQSKDQANLLHPKEYLIESDRWVYPNTSPPFNMNEKLVYSSSAYSTLYNIVFIYGSRILNSNNPPTLYAYKPDSNSWLYFPSNSFSGTVNQHAMALINDSYLLVTGGYRAWQGVCGFASTFVYDLKCGHWHQVDSLSQAAFDLRQGHSLTAYAPRTALLFGGYNQALLFNDLISLHLPDFSSLFNSSTCSDKIRCQHLSCTECLADSSCEWDVTLCQPRTTSLNQNSSQNSSTQANSLCPQQNNGCSFLSNCWECQVKPTCVWGGGVCKTRQFNDTSSSCALGCGSLSCEDCSVGGCLYCPSQERCVTSDYPVQFPYGQCLIWTSDKGNCTNVSSPDRCSAYKTCDECEFDYKCGWCSTHSSGLGNCIDGSLAAPTHTNSCSNFSWHYFECPPCQCNGHSYCNDSSIQCVGCKNNTQGEHCETCASWFYGDSRNGGSCSPCQCSEKYGAGCDPSNGICDCNTYGVAGPQCDQCEYNGTVNTSCYLYQEAQTVMVYRSNSRYIKTMLFMTQVSGQEQVNMILSLSGHPNAYAFVHIYRAVDREKDIMSSLSAVWDQLSPEVRAELLQKLQQNTSNPIVEAFGELYELRRLDALVLLVANEGVINTGDYPSYQVYTGSVKYQITTDDLETDNDFIFFEFSNISYPFMVKVDLTAEEVPLIVAVLVFLSVVLIFFIIMVLILLAWHIKKQIEFRQARVRRRRERIVMATRPASVTSLLASSVGPEADNFTLTRAIADQPLANSKVSLSTFLISMPNDPADPNRMPLYCGTALVTAGRNRETRIFSNQST